MNLNLYSQLEKLKACLVYTHLHIEAEASWAPFCRRHLIQISPEFFLVITKSAMVQNIWTNGGPNYWPNYALVGLEVFKLKLQHVILTCLQQFPINPNENLVTNDRLLLYPRLFWLNCLRYIHCATWNDIRLSWYRKLLFKYQYAYVYQYAYIINWTAKALKALGCW